MTRRECLKPNMSSRDRHLRIKVKDLVISQDLAPSVHKLNKVIMLKVASHNTNKLGKIRMELNTHFTQTPKGKVTLRKTFSTNFLIRQGTNIQPDMEIGKVRIASNKNLINMLSSNKQKKSTTRQRSNMTEQRSKIKPDMEIVMVQIASNRNLIIFISSNKLKESTTKK